MKFFEIIFENSNVKEARLYSAAKKAALNPEIGITIQNKAAYHVIKDCANITICYLPLYVFGNYTDPFKELYGKFTRADIQEFVNSTDESITSKQLLDIILSKLGKIEDTSPKQPTVPISVDESSDPYGDYGVREVVVAPTSNRSTALDTLCEVFGA